MRISIIVPAFNERDTIRQVVQRIVGAAIDDCELIIVDDGSTDGTTEILQSILPCEAKLVLLGKNGGKTAAVLAGLAMATGEWVLVQDADLEYDPQDIKRLLACADEFSVVFGRRPGCWHMPSRWMFASGVIFIDIAMMLAYGRWLRDHATCYKLIPRELLLQFDLASTGFEGCVEITAKLMRSGIPIRQIPISYSPRSVSAGKKLTVGYGKTALAAVWRYRRWQPSPDTQRWVCDVEHCAEAALCGSEQSTSV